MMVAGSFGLSRPTFIETQKAVEYNIIGQFLLMHYCSLQLIPAIVMLSVVVSLLNSVLYEYSTALYGTIQ
jgi:hypothetical protein